MFDVFGIGAGLGNGLLGAMNGYSGAASQRRGCRGEQFVEQVVQVGRQAQVGHLPPRGWMCDYCDREETARPLNSCRGCGAPT